MGTQERTTFEADEILVKETSNDVEAVLSSSDTNHTVSDNTTETHTFENLGNQMKQENATAANASEDEEEEVVDDDDVDDVDDDVDDSNDILDMVNLVADRWTPQPSWSIAPVPGDFSPPITSNECVLGLVEFFQYANPNATSNSNEDWLAAARLSVATESSSHLTGVRSLNAQPYYYAGGGLGNVDECLSLNTNEEDPLVHACMAGGTSRDSLTFASACVPVACSAKDVWANDFPERVAMAGYKSNTAFTKTNNSYISDHEVEYQELLSEYVTIFGRIAKIGEFLGTGWVCGEYVVDWEPFPSTMWCSAMLLCTIFTILGTRKMRRRRRRRRTKENDNRTKGEAFQSESISAVDWRQSSNSEIEQVECYLHDNVSNGGSSPASTSSSSSSSTMSSATENDDAIWNWFWSAWDIRAHIDRLTHQRVDTACLDGLKVGSTLWVIGAHVMAIQSSTGAGYLNPHDFLPPNGFTTTFLGQLLFSARWAVDTFLIVSGYLAALVLQRKLKNDSDGNSRWMLVLKVIIFRVIRIMPLYVCCLGFWMFLAPHMGSGPFWYQWEHFLEPCRQLWWTNLLFINNFWPIGAPTEANCFYHSWYLAVDVQLFCLFAPWLVLVFQSSPTKARKTTLVLWLASVVGTAVLAYTQGWSVNSLDGYSVGIFDVEGYAKPHVRATSYLAGIFVAFWPRRQRRRLLKSKGRLAPQGGNNWAMVLVLVVLAALSFGTVLGAYSRRACTFAESPLEGDDCGSLWSPSVTFLYTAFGRAAWSICIAVLLHLCILGRESQGTSSSTKNIGEEDEEEDNEISVTSIVQKTLSWRIWTPLANLSFGAYLIHPIVIYLWFLGGREKVTFRLFTYAMEFCSITVVTFVASFAVSVLVEFPLGLLLRPPSKEAKRRTPEPHGNIDCDAEMATLLVQSSSMSSSLPTSKSQSYGSLLGRRQ